MNNIIEINKNIDALSLLLNSNFKNIRIFAQNEIVSLNNDLRKIKISETPDLVTKLLLLIPKHDRTSCSDENAQNIGRCRRCTLLKMQSNGSWDIRYDFKIEINNIS